MCTNKDRGDFPAKRFEKWRSPCRFVGEKIFYVDRKKILRCHNRRESQLKQFLLLSSYPLPLSRIFLKRIPTLGRDGMLVSAFCYDVTALVSIGHVPDHTNIAMLFQLI